MKRFLFLMCAITTFYSCLVSCSREELIPDYPLPDSDEQFDLSTKSKMGESFQLPCEGDDEKTWWGTDKRGNDCGGDGSSDKSWADKEKKDAHPGTLQNQDTEKILYFVDILPKKGGTVYGSGEYEKGTTVTCYAVPDSGFKFVRWSGGTITSTSPTITFTVNDNIILIPQFVRK